LKDGGRKNKSESKIDVVLAKFVETGKFIVSILIFLFKRPFLKIRF
jgi:hypothetical protein